ncbi:MAG: HD domain-containing protein [Planctomycetaceae bacterium]|nr:HD domain-containing protein [Planctomycetaceae bacterium]
MSSDRLRRRAAFEAARLIYTREETQYCRAKIMAVRQFTAAKVDPGDLPRNREIRSHLKAFDRATPGEQRELVLDPTATFGAPDAVQDRFRAYALLLLPLENVAQAPEEHPEGDVLYHSLQVFELARQARSYDEDFLLAALLHDVGKAVDRQDHVAAALAILDGIVSPRTAWLIEHHVEALSLRQGALGVRLRRRLEASDDFDELMLLADCDRRGRSVGVDVPDVQDALEAVRQLAAECDDD